MLNSEKAHLLFMDIEAAAREAGCSVRQFRRIIDEDGIPLQDFGKRQFILSRDFQAWRERTEKKS
jgi:hypothetical protein